MLKIANDFGSVDLTPELRHCIAEVASAAAVLQMTIGEFAEILVEAPTECPCCVAEAAEASALRSNRPGSGRSDFDA